jgi:hypothetical protein
MFNFKVIPDGKAAFEVVATSRDVMIWEKTNKGASLGKVFDNQNLSDLYKIAYIATQRQKLFVGTGTEFEDTCDIVPFETEEDDADPFEKTATSEA